MTLSIFRKIELTFILTFLRVIQAVEEFSIYSLATLVLIVSLTITGTYFSFAVSQNYFTNISNGFVANTFPIYSNSSTFNNVLGVASSKAVFPIKVTDVKAPETTARAVYVYDKKNKSELYEKRSSEKLAPASTTKLMTALVALDTYNSTDIIEISEACTKEEGTKAGLPAGTKYKFPDLLSAMLIASAADATCAIAETKISRDEFVYRMNIKAEKLGMTATLFTNPIGLDGDKASHFSTAKNLYILANYAMTKPEIALRVRIKEFNIKSIGETFIGKLETTNKLLFEIPQTIGVKTGKTTEAGEVLIYEYKDDIKDFVIIVMGSEDRFTDVRALLNWLLVNYKWQ